MVKIYNDLTIAERHYPVRLMTQGYFNSNTLPNLDFQKYDFIFQDIEKPEWINYEFWCLKNMFGKCSFTQLSNGMKNLMNYLYFAEKIFNGAKQHEIMDISFMGPNVQYYLFKYANYYEVPFYFFNFEFDFFKNKPLCGNPILDIETTDVLWSLNDSEPLEYFDFLTKYDNLITEIDDRRAEEYERNRMLYD